MKKNFVLAWVFVFSFFVCAVPAFAEITRADGAVIAEKDDKYYAASTGALSLELKAKDKLSFKKQEGFYGNAYIQVVGCTGAPDSRTGAPFFVRVDGEKQPAHYSGGNPVKGDPSLIYIDRTIDNKMLAKKRYVSIPDYENKFNGEIQAIITGSQQYVDIYTYNATSWFLPSSNAYLFTIQPNSEVAFQKFHPDNAPNGMAVYPAFMVKSGEVKQDVNFKGKHDFEEMMDYYAETVWSTRDKAVVLVLSLMNTYVSGGTELPGAWLDYPPLQKAKYFSAKMAGGTLVTGGLLAMAPSQLIPLEYASTLGKTLIKAYSAYFISWFLGNQPKDLDEFKADLYILFLDKDLKPTFNEISQAAGVKAVGKATRNELIATLSVQGFKAITKSSSKVFKVFNSLPGKLAAKGVKAVPVISHIISAYEVATDTVEMTRFCNKAIDYYISDAAEEKKPAGITVENKTGAVIGIIERKNGSSWPSLLMKNVANNSKSEFIALDPGRYDIRARALATNAADPSTTVYVKKNVQISADSTTNVTFTANDKYAWTRDENKEFIQARCRFSDPKGVWAVMDKHSSPDDLYRTWAQSYPNASYYPYPRPGSGTDKEVIQAQCKFRNPQAVWDAAAKHKNANDLLKKWADSYYNK